MRRALLATLPCLVLLAAGCKEKPAECDFLPVCKETPDWPLCPDPRCCRQDDDGSWEIVTYTIACLDVVDTPDPADAADAPDPDLPPQDAAPDLPPQDAAPDLPPDAAAPVTYTLDPSTLTFFGLPIGSIRYAVSGLDRAHRTCVTVVWHIAGSGAEPGGPGCGEFPEHSAYAIVVPDTDGPCGAWEYSGYDIVEGSGCWDWGELGPGHLDLADFDATFAGPGPVRVVVDDRNVGDAWPHPVSIGFRYSSDVPEDAYVQELDATSTPAWVEVRKDGTPVRLFFPCGPGGCITTPRDCVPGAPRVANVTGGTAWVGSIWMTWDGLLRSYDAIGDCWTEGPAPAGAYVARFCYAWQKQAAAGGGEQVFDPMCVDQPFTLPADQVLGVANVGG